MPIYKIQIKENGEIFGYQKIESIDDAFWIDGIEVEQEFYDLVAADLWLAINTYYFDFVTETFIARPEMEADHSQSEVSEYPSIDADSLDSVTFEPLPVPCVVKVDDQEFILDDPNDPIFEFSTPVAGTYIITAEQFPYKPKSWTVEAV
jgi:hypothetical protein